MRVAYRMNRAPFAVESNAGEWTAERGITLRRTPFAAVARVTGKVQLEKEPSLTCSQSPCQRVPSIRDRRAQLDRAPFAAD